MTQVDSCSVTNLLTFSWHLRPNSDRTSASSVFLAACREHLPHALPVLFGPEDPPRGRFDHLGDAAFDASWFSPERQTWSSDLPFISGTPDIRHRSKDGRIRISAVSTMLEDPALNAGAQSMFSEVAVRLGCFYAQVGVERVYDAATERGPKVQQPDLHRPWQGLPMDDIWLAYFGREYAKVVSPYLDLQEFPDEAGLYEFTNAWIGPERRDDATLVGIVPTEFIQGHSDLLRRRAVADRAELRRGLKRLTAGHIPADLTT